MPNRRFSSILSDVSPVERELTCLDIRLNASLLLRACRQFGALVESVDLVGEQLRIIVDSPERLNTPKALRVSAPDAGGRPSTFFQLTSHGHLIQWRAH